MILYVLRHAEAVAASDDLPDEWRYLTETGAKSVGRVAQNISRYGRKPRLIISSPLVRAVQTAQIAASYACRRNEVMVSGLLQSDGDLDQLQDLLRTHDKAKRLMVVGHEPHLGSFVAGLLRKDDPIVLKKGGCVALELDSDPDKPARFLWYMVPGKKPVTSLKKAFGAA
ncbi:MAG TPA: phosphohistidine phosphatase SixA [Desulfuromonadaceae bacterium]